MKIKSPFEKYGKINFSELIVFRFPEEIRKSFIFLNKIYCSKKFYEKLCAALLDVISQGLEQHLYSYDGCYNHRPIRGYEKEFERLMEQHDVNAALKLLSAHSWANAIDFNAAGNKLGALPKMDLGIVRIFKAHGFDWGGDFDRKDGMHFELS